MDFDFNTVEKYQEQSKESLPPDMCEDYIAVSKEITNVALQNGNKLPKSFKVSKRFSDLFIKTVLGASEPKQSPVKIHKVSIVEDGNFKKIDLVVS